MILSAKQVIDKRRQLWAKKDVELDRQYREATANYLLSDKGRQLRQEVYKNPEYLIEMFFVIVDKDQQTVPFFLNEVQQELIQIINNGIELYLTKESKLHLKYLLLKGRQQGMTSFINAYQACKSYNI